MRKATVTALLCLSACSVNSDPGSVTTTAPATVAAAPEAPTSTTEAPTTTVEATTTTEVEVTAPPTTERVRPAAPTTIVKVFTSQVGPSLAGGELASIRACESGGDYTTDTGNGYYGAYQFSWGTWASVGGSGNPAHASASEQDMRAQMMINAGRRGEWPNC